MSRKKSYKIAEHEKSLNRVDIFRSVQSPNRAINLTETPLASVSNYTGNYLYENPSFIESNLNINKNKKRPGVWTIPDPDVNSIDSRQRQIFFKQKKSKTSPKCSRPIIAASIIFLIILILVAIALGIFLGIYLSSKSLFECSPKCTENRYCLESKLNNSNPVCSCKPGYVDDTKKCSKSICFSEYIPYSYVNTITDSSSKPVEYESKFTRPYCCPTDNQLTDSCCGVARKTKDLMRSVRIVGGDTIEEGIFPWIVFVVQVYRENPNSPLKLIKNCSGSLINKNYVVTAAHCMHFESSYNTEFPNIERVVRVFFGFVDKTNLMLYSEINQRRVSKVIIHPDFQSVGLRNDIALIKLDKPIPRNDLVDYICLFHYDQTDNLVESKKLYTAGWGNTEKYGSNYPNKLNYIDVKIFDIDDCKYLYPPEYDYLFDTNINVCAGYEAVVGKDSCDQDSGGPLMVELEGQWFLYGKFLMCCYNIFHFIQVKNLVTIIFVRFF